MPPLRYVWDMIAIGPLVDVMPGVRALSLLGFSLGLELELGLVEVDDKTVAVAAVAPSRPVFALALALAEAAAVAVEPAPVPKTFVLACILVRTTSKGWKREQDMMPPALPAMME